MLILLSCASPSADPADTDPADTDTRPAACDEVPVGQVDLSVDEQPHGSPIEWWYWTGHFQDSTERWYGFEEVFFVFNMGGSAFEMGHSAVTDVAADTFDYDVKVGLWDGEVPDSGFGFAMDDWTAVGGGGHDTLHTAVGDKTLDLDLVGTKAPVLQHGDGYTDYDFGGYTYYYSRTRMDLNGTLDVGGVAGPVSGTGWFDHQWGDLGTAVDEGWDWFALQLDDDRELMLFSVRAGATPELVGGTLTAADCTSTELAPEDVTVTATGSWTSPWDGCVYPSGWEITAGGETYVVTPVREDQEIVSTEKTYWEGANTVTGSATGRAYVELTGYCD